MGRKGIRPYALSNLIELFSLSKRATTILEFLVFLALGVAAGIAIVQPVNAPQAIAAGLGWTGLFTRDVYRLEAKESYLSAQFGKMIIKGFFNGQKNI